LDSPVVAIAQPTPTDSYQPRSDEQQSTNGRWGHSKEKHHSGSNTLVMPQQSAERFMANNLLTFGEWIKPNKTTMHLQS
jgi:hypothetical protein